MTRRHDCCLWVCTGGVGSLSTALTALLEVVCESLAGDVGPSVDVLSRQQPLCTAKATDKSRMSTFEENDAEKILGEFGRYMSSL